MSYTIHWKTSPNYRKGRNGKQIMGICNHQTAGQFPGCLSWLCNPDSKASAHYLITRDGQIFQMVRDKDTAYHAGIVNKPTWALYNGTNPNQYLIGIEHECYPTVGGNGNLTEVQYQATLWLHKQLITQYNLPIDSNHIIGHCVVDTVSRRNCPGASFPWDRLFADLRNGVIDLALEKWMVEGGQAALKALADKGLVDPASIPARSTEKELAEPFPSYLAWMMLNRLAEYKGGK